MDQSLTGFSQISSSDSWDTRPWMRKKVTCNQRMIPGGAPTEQDPGPPPEVTSAAIAPAFPVHSIHICDVIAGGPAGGHLCRRWDMVTLGVRSGFVLFYLSPSLSPGLSRILVKSQTTPLKKTHPQ